MLFLLWLLIDMRLLSITSQLVTHERDMLTRDVKRFEMEKDVASAAAAAAAAAASSKYGRHGAGAVGQPFGAGSFSTESFTIIKVLPCAKYTNFNPRLYRSRPPPQPNSFRFSSDSKQTR